MSRQLIGEVDNLAVNTNGGRIEVYGDGRHLITGPPAEIINLIKVLIQAITHISEENSGALIELPATLEIFKATREEEQEITNRFADVAKDL